ncbi:MAG: accessory factor UbiK family protein [Pseudomonadota bacterium]
MKLDSSKIDEVVSKLKESLPDEIGNLKQAGETKLKLVLEGALQRLEVVSREEYDVQAEVLQRTRQRVDDLEKRISELENK